MTSEALTGTELIRLCRELRSTQPWAVGDRKARKSRTEPRYLTTIIPGPGQDHCRRPLPSLQREFLEVLQAIRCLLARSKCFRPEREWPGGYLTHGTRAPFTRHTQCCNRKIREACGRASAPTRPPPSARVALRESAVFSGVQSHSARSANSARMPLPGLSRL